MNTELTESESSRLEKCEAVIERGKQTFMDVGHALLEIRDSRLYRGECKTFDEYCRERWGMDRTYAHRLIESSKISLMLPISNKPKNEAQVRPLVGLPENQAKQAWAEASKDGAPTAAKVAAAVKKTMPPPLKARPVYDVPGRKVPDILLPVWQRKQELQDMLTLISKARTEVRRMYDSKKDKLYAHVEQGLLTSLNTAYAQASHALPYSVCPSCQGMGTCKLCKGSGFIGKYAWDTVVSREMKAAVMAQVKK